MSSEVGSGQRRQPRVAVSERARMVFAAIMIGWLLFPALQWGTVALDVVPLLAAGRVVTTDPGDVYVTDPSDPYAMSPRFREEACRTIPADMDCDPFVVPFTHTPLVLPFITPLSKLPTDVAVLVCRVIAAAALVGGMVLLWRSVAPRSRDAGAMLAGSAVLLSPLAFATVRLGQSSALLFLSVCYGVSRTRANRPAAAASAVWAVTIVMKAYPAGMGVIALVQRRWRLLAYTAAWCAALLVAALAIGRGQIFSDFFTSTRAVRQASLGNTYSRGIDGMIGVVFPSWNGDSIAFMASLAARAAAIVALWMWRLRRTSADGQWAFGWVALLWFIPVVWFHYYWVIVGAVFLLAADRLSSDARWIRLLPAVSAVIFVGALVDVQSTVVTAVFGVVLLFVPLGLALLAVPQDAPLPADGAPLSPIVPDQ